MPDKGKIQLPDEFSQAIAVQIASSWFDERDAILACCNEVATITDEKGSRHAAELLKQCTRVANAAEIQRKELSKPFLAAQRAIKAVGDDARQPLLAAKVNMQRAIQAYVAEQRRQAAEEAARRQTELDEQLALQQAADALFGDDAPDTMADLPSPTAVVLPATPCGISMRKSVKFEVMDIDALPIEYLKVNEAAIRAYIQGSREAIIKNLADTEQDEGFVCNSAVRVWVEETPTSRG